MECSKTRASTTSTYLRNGAIGVRLAHSDVRTAPQLPLPPTGTSFSTRTGSSSGASSGASRSASAAAVARRGNHTHRSAAHRRTET